MEMSTSTGAPAALARSEGSRLETKGTAAPTVAAPPKTEVATTRLRLALSGFLLSFMSGNLGANGGNPGQPGIIAMHCRKVQGFAANHFNMLTFLPLMTSGARLRPRWSSPALW